MKSDSAAVRVWAGNLDLGSTTVPDPACSIIKYECEGEHANQSVIRYEYFNSETSGVIFSAHTVSRKRPICSQPLPSRFFSGSRPALELKVPYDKGLHLLCNPSSEIEWCVFFKGYYEPDLSIFLKPFVKSGMTVFDIGANVGVHTLLTASRVKGTGRVFAVEPNPHIRRRLKQNLELNGFEDRVTVFSCGLSDHSGEAQFYIPAEGGSNMGISSLYPSADLPQEVRIKLRTLDSLIEETGVNRLDLIKIDTEGSDMAVLRGAQKTLARFSPTIVVEINYEASEIANKEIADGSGLLADLGYQIFRLTRIGRLQPVDPGHRLPPGNVICKR